MLQRCCFFFYFIFFLMNPRTPRSTQLRTLFPYTTLFRSRRQDEGAHQEGRRDRGQRRLGLPARSEEHTSELQSPSVTSYAVFCLTKKRLLRQCFVPLWPVSATPRLPHRLFFFPDRAPTEIYTAVDTLSLHDALPI